jgi:pimeloyl-ACP methyl ester carboxylesterase
VLVSFSSSAPLATVFAAKHFELVKGIVFVDPSLSATPGAKSWRRVLWRVNVVNPLQALFGYMRMQRAIVDRHAPPSSPESERLSAILNSTHHWIASTEESMALDESAEEANAAIATRPFGELPLGVLTTADPAKSELLRDIFDRQKRLAANSERGILRAVHSVHSQLLKDPVTVGSIIDLIRTIADEARGDMTGAQ